MLEPTEKKPTVTNAVRRAKMEYTIREAAELRGVHPRTVRRKILRREIAAQLKFVDLLKTSIYFIPKNELPKIKAEPGGRPRKPV